MKTDTVPNGDRANRWRAPLWSAAAALFLLPLLIMQITDEMNWDAQDFAIFGAMLVVACSAYEITVRLTRHTAYRIGAGVLLAVAFILVWVDLAVGIVGN